MKTPVVLLLFAAATAGCLADDSGSRPEPADPGPARLPDVFGTVHDQDRTPLPGVTVSLFELGRTAVTGPNGTFGFDNVTEDATFLVLAQKDGYLSASQDIQMIPGFKVRVNLSLSEIAGLDQVLTVDEHRGILECQTAVTGAVGDGPTDCPNTETRYDTWEVGTFDRLKSAVLEVFWDRSTGSTGHLAVQVEGRTDDGFILLGEAEGESPLRVELDAEDLQDVDERLRFMIFAAPDETGGPVAAGTAFQQTFEAFTSLFYNQPAEEGYSIA